MYFGHTQILLTRASVPCAWQRKLNKIKTNVIVAKSDKVVSLEDKGKCGAGGGGGAGAAVADWTCPACLATVFGTKDKCFKCQTPKPKNASCFAHTASSSGAGSSNTADRSASGASSADAPPAKAATIVLKEWQRLPRQLLQQLTDKQKAAKPDFQLVHGGAATQATHAPHGDRRQPMSTPA